MNYIVLCLITLFISSCAGLMGDRSYVDQMDRQNDHEMFKAGKDFDVVAGDSGRTRKSISNMRSRAPASEKEQEEQLLKLNTLNTINQMKKNLVGNDLEKYNNVKDVLPDNEAKIYYLNLSKRERIEYLKSLGIGVSFGNYYNSSLKRKSNFKARELFHLPSIHEGMQKSDVAGIWGEPNNVEIAGNPQNQNEKWSFYQNGNLNIVYFEGGIVQGWKLQ